MTILYCIIKRKKERKKMRKPPKTETIRKSINRYAYIAGFTYHPHTDGTVSLFDIRANYYVFRGAPDRVAQFVVDELYMKYWRETGCPA